VFDGHSFKQDQLIQLVFWFDSASLSLYLPLTFLPYS